MNRLIDSWHAHGPTKAWLEQMAFFVLRHESLDETSLTWFAHYLDDINTGALEIQNPWPPVTVALTFLNHKCPALKRAVRAISHQAR